MYNNTNSIVDFLGKAVINEYENLWITVNFKHAAEIIAGCR